MICGIDEAGRGCIAGPLVVAGVILHEDFPYKDSKRLSPKMREKLFGKISQNPHCFKVFSNEDVDNLGLSACLRQGLKTIMAKLEASRYLFDGNCNYGVCGLETMIKADAQIHSVAAASILAKVIKDKILCEKGKEYPFNFCAHQGYATKAHIEEIKKYGYSSLHRKTFKLKGLL